MKMYCPECDVLDPEYTVDKSQTVFGIFENRCGKCNGGVFEIDISIAEQINIKRLDRIIYLLENPSYRPKHPDGCGPL